MQKISRRQFLQLGAILTASMGFDSSVTPAIADALEELIHPDAPVLWLHGQSCSGCTVSFLDAEHPDPAELLTMYFSLLYHSTLSAVTGHQAVEYCNRIIAKGDYTLIVEGAVPAGMAEACRIGHQLFTDQLARAAKKAKTVIALGTCAAFGGIPAAENNPTGAVSVPDFLGLKNITGPMVRIPGCPSHPDWIVGTLVHLLKFGMPHLDDMLRPVMFFGKTVHNQCSRFADYEREKFAAHFGDDGCLFKLGCLGINTHADCPVRLRNGGFNSCIQTGAPCIGCSWEGFVKQNRIPMYRKGEQHAVLGG